VAGLCPLLGVFGEQEWNRFRGPNGSGVSTDSQLSTEMDLRERLLWRRSLGSGYSSPVSMGDRLIVTTAEAGRLATLCIDAASGETAWCRWAPIRGSEAPERAGMPAAPTPSSDGKSVVVLFPEYGLLCYDREGNELWNTPLDTFSVPYGMAASPVLSNGQVFLVCDQSQGSFVAAFDAGNGKELWRRARPWATSSFSTPILHQPVDGASQLIVSGAHRVTAYRTSDGFPLWWVDGLSWQAKSVPVISGDKLFVHSWMPSPAESGVRPLPKSWGLALQLDSNEDGKLTSEELGGLGLEKVWFLYDLDESEYLDQREFGEALSRTRAGRGLFAIRLDGAGDVTNSHSLWNYRRSMPLVASPLVHAGLLYLVGPAGMLTCLDPSTGQLIKAARVEGLNGAVHSSPIAAGDALLLCSVSGDLAVIEAGRNWSGKVCLSIDEPIYATPAIANGRLFVRGANSLQAYDLGERISEAALETIALVGVDVLSMEGDGVGRLRDQTVLLRGSRIEEIGPRERVVIPEQARTLSLPAGATVLPGLIDLQARMEDPLELHRHLAAGVVGVRVVHGRAALLDARDRFEASGAVLPRCWIGAPWEADIQALDQRDLRGFKEHGYDFLDRGCSPDAKEWSRLARLAQSVGLTTLGDSPSLVLNKARSQEAGVASTATPSLQGNLHLLLDDDLFESEALDAHEPSRVAEALVHLNASWMPRLRGHLALEQGILSRAELLAQKRMRYLSPVAAEVWGFGGHALRVDLEKSQLASVREGRRWLKKVVFQFSSREGALLIGSDAMNALVHPGDGLHEELALLRACGVPASELLRAATVNAAPIIEALGHESVGVLRAGGRADLIVVNGDPITKMGCLRRPLYVIVAGQPRSSSQLRGSLSDMARTYRLEADFLQAVSRTGFCKAMDTMPQATDWAALLSPASCRRMCEWLCHPKVQRTADAIGLALHCQAVWPDAPWPWTCLARAQSIRGDYELALTHCEQALLLNPGDREASDLVSTLHSRVEEGVNISSHKPPLSVQGLRGGAQ
jgi:outer membrane protein assembly factor BamB